MPMRSNHYTLMFVPDDHGKTFSLRVHKSVIRSLILFLVVFIIGLGLLLYKAGVIAAKLQLVSSLIAENKKLEGENTQYRLITQKIEGIEQLSAYLQNLALMPGPGKMAVQTAAVSPNQADNITEDISELARQIKARTPGLQGNALTPEQFVVSIPNILPVEGWITRRYIADSTGRVGHHAVDFAAATGTPVKATAPGMVEDIHNDKFLGIIVSIKHEYGFVTRYAHCSQVLVAPRDAVHRGQTIALVGSTGRSTAPHLHYEIIKDGKNMNPSDYLISHQD